MNLRHKEAIDWLLVLVFLGWGIWFLQAGNYFSTLILWLGAILLLPYLASHFKTKWDFHYFEQFKWPVLVVLLSLLILSTQMSVPTPMNLPAVSPKVVVIEREIFAPEVQQPAEVPKAGELEIRIIEGGFSPQEVAIVPGTTVIWRNTWSVHVLHVYQLDGKYINIAQSEKLGLGDTFSYTFERSGIYQFRDLYFGWKGKVHVS